MSAGRISSKSDCLQQKGFKNSLVIGCTAGVEVSFVFHTLIETCKFWAHLRLYLYKDSSRQLCLKEPTKRICCQSP